ncbi:S1 family peptidase [Alkalicoccus chagannorensis]|uniref:S1 family peptidase n=1 Tax=Alkalicoccus chagannorensis TaxID=427072 RepID=UPI00040B6FF2|nr:serine protease [Alkalicoccus chagannorensis]
MTDRYSRKDKEEFPPGDDDFWDDEFIEDDIVPEDDEEDEFGGSEEKPKEPLYFDGERYMTREEFFNPPDEVQESVPKRKSKRFLKVTIAFVLTAALLVNVFSVWPQLFNFPAAAFLSNAAELRGNEEVQGYKDSVVVVRADDSKGTGFVFDDGMIMTNEHVIRDGVDVTVHFENGDAYQVEVVEEREDLDIAILDTHAQEDWDHPELPLDGDWEERQEVYVIGNPGFFNFIPNEGELLGQVPMSSKEEPVTALDAPIYRGSSGSPVITGDGEVIAVVYATSNIEHAGESMRAGLAIDMNWIVDEMDTIDFTTETE